jgi:ATP-dependent helicase HrpB
VLEPRRVVAKAAARRMAALLSERVGERVGYRVRLEARVSSDTRVEVVTTGVLLRRLQRARPPSKHPPPNFGLRSRF